MIKTDSAKLLRKIIFSRACDPAPACQRMIKNGENREKEQQTV